MKRVLTFLMAVMLFVTVVPFVSASTTFSDVPRSHWAYKEIQAMASKGIIKGYEDGKFRPNNKVTRAEFAKIMIAAAGVDIHKQKVSQTFQDVPRNHWAFYYVEYAKPYLTGYKSGNKYTYKPDQYAVREDIAVALVRLLGYDRTHKADLSVLKRFNDDDRISAALRPYVAISIQTDLMKGSNNYFRPQDAITRAEAASLLYRALLDREDDETKVVFPSPDKPTPELPTSVSDNFSSEELKNWDTDNAVGTWGVINKQATATTTDRKLEHFFLPLIWNEKANTDHFEMSVDVNANGTNGLGGLYFNAKDGKAHVVFLNKDRVTLATVDDVNDDDFDTIASGSYKLKGTNKLKIVVKDDAVSIYMNNQYLFGQEKLKLSNTQLGLYLQKDATKDAPRKLTSLDNFTFKVLD
ncbi:MULTISPECIES: S-layer homology domain-containing protein [Brevibacillus]|jgi:hypothetical protein|uniref:SLH domain-containing protein n=1 Tax=Brevibacillus borstelensis AK1 TaxID=1300222 RepID=M8DKT3_9BACL|nr:S-layer homology domain-containing protein [Brevibacillus borstelensis]EMT54082.1 hypothetical protein I532_00710 [Brevibacillus borstelensis AK1]KKX53910.1 S-layer protein [Brevibacillus borstelensis cifa_chp40]MBE5397931.1 S-layer homology domain-containing protein [Brevibacillus borstelensis]MCC0563555.1 S-layer homology domain-containing protein [Brevibacillus borstelensis]MCM3469636.1 S-layer homology domain-containing protein [Brevibacillus borstelensis]